MAALYKAIHRGIKYTPGGSQLSPMRPRSILGGKLSLPVDRVKADPLVFIPLDVVFGKSRPLVTSLMDSR